MSNFKSTVKTIAFIVIIVSLVCGTVYLVKEKRDREWALQLALVEGFIDEDKFEDAQTALLPLLAQVKDSKKGANLRVLYMDVLLKNDSMDDAQTVGVDLVAKHPDTPAAAVANCLLGKIALANNETEQANDHFQAVLELESALEDGADSIELKKARLGLALVKKQRNRLAPAKEDLDMLLEDETLGAELKGEVETALGDVNVALLLSPVKLPDDITYRLNRGDTINGIGIKYGITDEILLRCNNIRNPESISENQRIKVPNAQFSIIVDKWDNTMLLQNNGKFFKRYSVRTGKYADLTPTGEFKITNKKKNPIWNDPNTGRKYLANDPENELGTRWMAFEGAMLGIHGTIHPESIGLYTSEGCVGMLKEDVEELFDLVRIGTPMEIVGTQNQKILELGNGGY